MTEDASEIQRLIGEGLTRTEAGARLGLSRHQVRRRLNAQDPLEGHRIASNALKWGYGPAALVKPAAHWESQELVVFGSDFHFPYQDDQAIRSFLNLIRRLQPHRVVLNGDVADFFQLSRFDVAGERVDHLQEEIDQANDFRKQVREAALDATIDETEGNHDNRILSYVQKNARSLKSLRALKPSELFRYGDYQINWHSGSGFLLRKHFLVRHGTIVRAEAGASAKAELMQAGISGISGHTHRLARYTKGGYVQRSWLEQGCLCRTDPDYVPTGKPNWQQGAAVGEFSTRSDSFVLHEVPFVGGKLRFGREGY